MKICPLGVYEARMVRREQKFRDQGFKLSDEHADCRELIQMVGQLRELLAVAKCPDIECYGEGTVRIGNYGDIEQCQWCYEKEKLLGSNTDE